MFGERFAVQAKVWGGFGKGSTGKAGGKGEPWDQERAER